jgi:GTPase SAR1 family protein
MLRKRFQKPVPAAVRERFRIICVGAQGAGKSSMLASIQSQDLTQVTPTNGFNIVHIPHGNDDLTIVDLGGMRLFRCSILQR